MYRHKEKGFPLSDKRFVSCKMSTAYTPNIGVPGPCSDVNCHEKNHFIFYYVQEGFFYDASLKTKTYMTHYDLKF